MPSGPQPQPPDWTVRLAVSNTYEGTPWSNIFWARVSTTDTPSVSAFDTFLEDVAASYSSSFFGFLETTVSGVDVHGTFFGAGSDAIDGFGSQPASGAASSPGEAANVAACISWPIAAHYRGGHPRTYLCGIPVSARVNPTTFDSAFTDNVAGAAENFRQAVNGLTLASHDVELGTVSFVHLGAWRTPPLFRPYGSGAVVDSRVDTQRRRLGRDR